MYKEKSEFRWTATTRKKGKILSPFFFARTRIINPRRKGLIDVTSTFAANTAAASSISPLSSISVDYSRRESFFPNGTFFPGKKTRHRSQPAAFRIPSRSKNFFFLSIQNSGEKNLWKTLSLIEYIQFIVCMHAQIFFYLSLSWPEMKEKLFYF